MLGPCFLADRHSKATPQNIHRRHQRSPTLQGFVATAVLRHAEAKGSQEAGMALLVRSPSCSTELLGPLLHLQINMINTVRGEVCQVGHEQELYLTFADWFILSALGYTQVDPGWTKE